jgi:hypothetical protein
MAGRAGSIESIAKATIIMIAEIRMTNSTRPGPLEEAKEDGIAVGLDEHGA